MRTSIPGEYHTLQPSRPRKNISILPEEEVFEEKALPKRRSKENLGSASLYGTLSRSQRKSFETLSGSQNVHSFGTIRRRPPSDAKGNKDDVMQYVEFRRKRKGSKASSKEIRFDQNTPYTLPFLTEGYVCIFFLFYTIDQKRLFYYKLLVNF